VPRRRWAATAFSSRSWAWTAAACCASGCRRDLRRRCRSRAPLSQPRALALPYPGARLAAPSSAATGPGPLMAEPEPRGCGAGAERGAGLGRGARGGARAPGHGARGAPCSTESQAVQGPDAACALSRRAPPQRQAGGGRHAPALVCQRRTCLSDRLSGIEVLLCKRMHARVSPFVHLSRSSLHLLLLP